MQTIFLSVPNIDDPVEAKVFTMRDLRNIIKLRKSPTHVVEYLEGMIITKNLNRIDMFLSLLSLFDECVSSTVPINNSEGDTVKIYVDSIFSRFLDYPEIVTKVNITKGMDIILDYPIGITCGGFTDYISKVIIDGNETITLKDLSVKDRQTIYNSLPSSLSSTVLKFIEDNSEIFKFSISKNKKLSRNVIDINSNNLQMFITNSFITMNEMTFREYIFVLSKRVTDINFLMESTPKDLDDFYKLYNTEIDKESSNNSNS